MASALNAMAKYALSIWEFRRAAYRGGENAPPWENKSMWVFYVDLMTGERLSATAGVMNSPCSPYRLPQVDDVPDILHFHSHVLWDAFECCS